MPDKYYIIPVDANGYAYLGVKSLINPYTNTPYNFCAGCPNLFGGNLQTDMANTLYLEAREESRFKIDLEQSQLQLPNVLHLLLSVGPPGDSMTFYAMRGHFTVREDVYFPQTLANQSKYKETTGDLLRINLATLTTTNRQATANAALVIMGNTLQNPPAVSPAARGQFQASESAEALRLAADAVQLGTL